MKYISIDIETTGLDQWEHQILQIAMVYEDTNLELPLGKLPHIDLFIEHENLNFQEGALKIHTSTGLLDRYFEGEKVSWSDAIGLVIGWLEELGYEYNDDDLIEIVVAGKNYNGFDRLFLHSTPEWRENIKEHRRVVDPTTMYIDWEEDDVPPSLFTCLKRADPQHENFADDVSHDALEDAFDVIRVLRNVQENWGYNAREPIKTFIKENGDI